MMSLIGFAVAFVPVFAPAKVTTVVGVRARAIIEAAAPLELAAPAGLGRIAVDLDGVVAEKLGDEQGRYRGEKLAIEADNQSQQIDIVYEVLDEEIRRHTQRREQADQLENFRLALEDVAKAEVVQKPVVSKRVRLRKIQCLAESLGRNRDSVVGESSYSCKITTAR